MLWKIFMWRIYFALPLVLPAAAWAQQHQQEDAGRQRFTRELQGKVIQEKDIAVQDSPARHKIVLLELQGDERIAVDLGPTDALKDRIKVGDDATVHGRFIRVGEDPVFFAWELNANGQDYKVERPLTEMFTEEEQSGQQTGQQQSQRQGQPREYQVRGVVENEQSVDVRGGGQNKVVLVRTDEGKTVLVDLGPADKLQGVQVAQGSRISVKGNSGQAGEASILFATQLESGGQNIEVDRSGFQSWQQQQQQQWEQEGGGQDEE